MGVNQIDEVVTRGQHVAPRAEIQLQIIGRLHAKEEHGLLTSDRLGRIRNQLDIQIRGVFRREVGLQLRNVRTRRLLRRSSSR